nr:hypothetical protein [Thermus thermophilus]
MGQEAFRVKAKIGYATQEQSVYRDLTVEENLRFRAREAQALAGALFLASVRFRKQVAV